MARYKITCHCRACGHRWSRVTTKPDSPDPPCPNLACGENVVPIGMDLTSNRAPASIGQNVGIKAVDEAARIVTEDYGLSDINMTGQRPGDTAAPKLRPDMQQAADNMFAPHPARGRSPMPRMDAGILARYRDPKALDVMKAIHEAKWRPPTHIINEPSQ